MARGRAIGLCVLGLATAATLGGPAQADPGCGGLLQPPCPPPQNPPPPQTPPPSGPPPPGKATVTLRASQLYTVYGRQIKLTGKVTGAPAGRSTSLRLTSRAPAYKRSFLDEPGETDSKGRFTFYVRAKLNATYRVVIDEQSLTGRSNRVGVRVYPALNVDIGHDDYGDPDSIYVTVDGPSSFYFKTEKSAEQVKARRGGARVGYFYGIPRHSKRAYKLGRGRLKVLDCDPNSDTCELLAKWRLRNIPRLRKARRVLACLHGTAFFGMGSGYPACGRDVIRR